MILVNLQTLDLPPSLVVVLLEVLIGLESVVKGEEDVHAFDQVGLLVLFMNGNVKNGACVFGKILDRDVDFSVWQLELRNGVFEGWIPSLKKI